MNVQVLSMRLAYWYSTPLMDSRMITLVSTFFDQWHFALIIMFSRQQGVLEISQGVKISQSRIFLIECFWKIYIGISYNKLPGDPLKNEEFEISKKAMSHCLYSGSLILTTRGYSSQTFVTPWILPGRT